MTKARTDLKPVNGGHSRHYIKGSLERVERTAKHRYVYLVGDRRKKREMRKELLYPVIDEYPKGDSRRYDINNPIAVTKEHFPE